MSENLKKSLDVAENSVPMRPCGVAIWSTPPKIDAYPPRSIMRAVVREAASNAYRAWRLRDYAARVASQKS